MYTCALTIYRYFFKSLFEYRIDLLGIYSLSAYSAAADKIVGPGTTWEVSAAGDEDNPIDSIHISGVPTEIVFDGGKLSAS